MAEASQPPRNPQASAAKGATAPPWQDTEVEAELRPDLGRFFIVLNGLDLKRAKHSYWFWLAQRAERV